MALKSMGYDHPAYLARHALQFPLTAGAAGASSKFVAFAAMIVYSLVASMVTVGASTSSYTGWNGTATVTSINADRVSVLRVYNTASVGVAPVLATQTFGPFSISNYDGTSTNTQTNTAGFTNVIPLAYGGTATGAVQTGSATATGGFSVNQGDILYLLRGTDTAAVEGLALEYQIQPLTNLVS